MAETATARIVFHVAAGPDIGLGHLARSSGVAAALAVTGERVACVLEAPQDYPELTAAFPVQPVIVPTRDAARRVLKSLAPSSSPTVLVSDMMGLTEEDGADARADGYTYLVHLADDGEAAYGADLQFDTDVVPSLPQRPGRVLLSGAPYHVLRPAVTERRPSSPWSGDAVHRVLIALGGADPGECTEKMATGLMQSLSHHSGDDGKGPRFTIVLGPAMEEGRRTQAQQRFPELVVDGRGYDLIEAMLNHDLVVTLGGLSTYEAIALGRPVSCVSWSYMSGYVAKLAGAGLISDLGAAETATAALLASITHAERLRTLAGHGWETLDGRGAKRVAEAITRLSSTSV